MWNNKPREPQIRHISGNHERRNPGVSPPSGTFLVHFQDAIEECPRTRDGAEGGTLPDRAPESLPSGFAAIRFSLS